MNADAIGNMYIRHARQKGAVRELPLSVKLRERTGWRDGSLWAAYAMGSAGSPSPLVKSWTKVALSGALYGASQRPVLSMALRNNI